MTVAGTVVSVNRGGILVEFENLRGFVPSSHLAAVRAGSWLAGRGRGGAVLLLAGVAL